MYLALIGYNFHHIFGGVLQTANSSTRLLVKQVIIFSSSHPIWVASVSNYILNIPYILHAFMKKLLVALEPRSVILQFALIFPPWLLSPFSFHPLKLSVLQFCRRPKFWWNMQKFPKTFSSVWVSGVHTQKQICKRGQQTPAGGSSYRGRWIEGG